MVLYFFRSTIDSTSRSNPFDFFIPFLFSKYLAHNQFRNYEFWIFMDFQTNPIVIIEILIRFVKLVLIGQNFMKLGSRIGYWIQ